MKHRPLLSFLQNAVNFNARMITYLLDQICCTEQIHDKTSDTTGRFNHALKKTRINSCAAALDCHREFSDDIFGENNGAIAQ
ncbi:MAG: hypothetical protein EBU46_11880 [Nitrosomonadaceae bacterium]|nr:hypothetical protein [Nitrosomonadaceae bacterium]